MSMKEGGCTKRLVIEPMIQWTSAVISTTWLLLFSKTREFWCLCFSLLSTILADLLKKEFNFFRFLLLLWLTTAKNVWRRRMNLEFMCFWKAQWLILVLTIYYLTAKHNYQNTWLREIHYLLNFCATCPF